MGTRDRSILTDDGLVTPEIGEWGQTKYDLVSKYASIFATSMKNEWDCRVYIDLFAGSGRSRIRDTSKIVLASPLLAMKIADPFDRYTFCELDEEQLNALEIRAKAECPDLKPSYLRGDSNAMVQEILETIPKASKAYKVLTFCFADPFKMGNLRFSTIRELSRRFVDFLILIPSAMDALRNVETHYLNPANHTIDEFLGYSGWREEWELCRAKTRFDTFLTDSYGHQMQQLKYKYEGIRSTQEIRFPMRNIPLYRLAFFSRHDLGNAFWRDVKKACKAQGEFSFE